jgi:hypothetical protein
MLSCECRLYVLMVTVYEAVYTNIANIVILVYGIHTYIYVHIFISAVFKMSPFHRLVHLESLMLLFGAMLLLTVTFAKTQQEKLPSKNFVSFLRKIFLGEQLRDFSCFI